MEYGSIYYANNRYFVPIADAGAALGGSHPVRCIFRDQGGYVGLTYVDSALLHREVGYFDEPEIPFRLAIAVDTVLNGASDGVILDDLMNEYCGAIDDLRGFWDIHAVIDGEVPDHGTKVARDNHRCRLMDDYGSVIAEMTIGGDEPCRHLHLESLPRSYDETEALRDFVLEFSPVAWNNLYSCFLENESEGGDMNG